MKKESVGDFVKAMAASIHELLTCPISLQTMRDPVLLVASGMTYDSKSICESLLTFPDLDPSTGVRFGKPLQLTPNVLVRSILTATHGPSAYEKHDTSEFVDAYRKLWEEREALAKGGSSHSERHHATVENNIETNPDALYDRGTEAYDRNDMISAARWFREAANRGQSRAQYNLGYMYLNGFGVVANPVTAAEWYERSAVQGHMQAQYHLGCLYWKGRGVTKSKEEAVRLYRLSAEQGFPPARRVLGRVDSSSSGGGSSTSLLSRWIRRSSA